MQYLEVVVKFEGQYTKCSDGVRCIIAQGCPSCLPLESDHE